MLIDAHAHLDLYEDELDAALLEIEQRSIFTVSNSMSVPSYERNLEIAQGRSLILPIFGIHPWTAGDYADHLDGLAPYVEQSPMLGEIGLDFFFVKEPERYRDQRKVFEYFLAAAARDDKIVNLHTKGAERDVIDLLEAYGVERAIVHWYSGPLDILDEMIERGIYFTVGVDVLQSDEIRTIARRIPADRLLTETDNPGGLKWLSGSVGMPHVVDDVVRELAEVRQTAPGAIADTIHTNLLELAGDASFAAPLRSGPGSE